VRCHRQRLLVLAAAGLAAGCTTSTENPFVNAFRVRPPSAQCAILFASDLYSAAPPDAPEIFCVDSSGGSLERLTFCSAGSAPCAMLEAAPAADSKRMVARRVTADTNGNGRLDDGDSAGMVFVNLETSAVVDLVSQSGTVSGLDWSPVDDFVVYSAMGTGGKADLFAVNLGAQPPTPAAVTSTSDVNELRPRYGRVASYLVYQHVDVNHKGTIWMMNVAFNGPLPLTEGGDGSTTLSGGGPVIGSDGDPAVSTGDDAVAFRRLSDCGPLLPGAWDAFTFALGAVSAPTRLTSACAYRGAPDWGRDGIVFAETDPATGRSTLVLVDPTTGARRVIVAAPPGATVAYPRWLSASR
jgi:Tol biopolymer transport system component